MGKEKLSTNKNKTKSEIVLGSAQRKSLSVALKMLEERLHFFSLLMEKGSYSGVLYHFTVNLSEQEKNNFRQTAKRILQRIEVLKLRFDLKPVNENLKDRIVSSLTYLWTVLEDEKSKKLKRYGKVSISLQQELDPILNEIISDLNELANLIENRKIKD